MRLRALKQFTSFAQGVASNSVAGATKASPQQKLLPSFKNVRYMQTQKAGYKPPPPPVSINTLLMTLMAGAGVIYVAKQYKTEKLQEVMNQSQQVVGKASVGGPFSLTNQDGKPFTDVDLHGEFAVLYFGFTHCPDICPDEMEKLAESIKSTEKTSGVKIQSVFISVDPQRDTPAVIKNYVKEFHPDMIGLTGDFETIKKVSKSYRVYFNKTGESADDYLVDHSIIHYLINPDGDFVTFFNKNQTAEQIANSLLENAAAWQKDHPQYHRDKKLATFVK